MWTGENEMVMECIDCGYRGNWREFDFHFGDACPQCGSRAVGKSAEQSVHQTGGESAANLSLFPAEGNPPAKVTAKSTRR